MTVPALAPAPGPDRGSGTGANTGPDLLAEVLELSETGSFTRWEAQLAATGHCAHPIRLQGRIDATDCATGATRPVYDTDTEPGQVLLTACGNRREQICPACSAVYKRDARQIIGTGLTGGKGIPNSVAAHPCVFATLTAPSFGPVHTTRTGRRGQLLPCRPRRDSHARRCRHGRDISCGRTHPAADPLLGRPLCTDCYDYTGHVLFNALAPELWRRFTITVPRQLAHLAGLTRKQLLQLVRVRFVKVAEYQARGIIHYHAVIRLDAATKDHQPPPPGFGPALLKKAVVQAAAAITLDAAAHLDRLNARAASIKPGDTGSLPAVDADLRRIVRFGTQTDARPISRASALPATGTDLPAPAVANYIAKYATKAISTPGLPVRPVRSPAAIAALRCPAHHRRLISTCWELGKRPAAAQLALNRWTHMLGYRGHFLTKSRAYSVTFAQLRTRRTEYRRAERHPGGETDPWGRPLDDRLVLVEATWIYAGTGHATTGQHTLALAAAARAREHEQAAREESRVA